MYFTKSNKGNIIYERVTEIQRKTVSSTYMTQKKHLNRTRTFDIIILDTCHQSNQNLVSKNTYDKKVLKRQKVSISNAFKRLTDTDNSDFFCYLFNYSYSSRFLPFSIFTAHVANVAN